MERIDDLQRGGLKLIQDTDLFCFGTDAVLLAAFAKICRGWRVADFGCGSGAVTLLMYGRQSGAHYTGIEIQPKLYALFEKNIKMNSLDLSIDAVQGDIAEICKDYCGCFDAVVSNPPYEKAGSGVLPANESHAVARFEVKITFDALCLLAAYVLKPGGKFYFIHRSQRLPELMASVLKAGLAPKRMRMVHKDLKSFAGHTLMECVKDGRPYLKIEPPLIIYNSDGTRTTELEEMYRN